MGMDQEQMQRRLAAHAVAPEEVLEPEPKEEPNEVPEPVLKTVADVLRFTVQPSAVVIGLKRIGALSEESGTLVYKLQDKLAPPPPGAVSDITFLPTMRFSTVLTGYHVRRMRSYGEGNENAVAMSRVEALTGHATIDIDRLSYIDSYAVMAIAAAIVSDAGNV